MLLLLRFLRFLNPKNMTFYVFYRAMHFSANARYKNVTFTVVCLALGLHVFSNYDIRCKLKLRIFVRGAVVVVAFEAVMKIVKK